MTLLISPPLLHSMCRIRNTMLLVFDGTIRRTEWLHLTVLPSNLFEFGCSTHISVMVHNDRLLVRPRVETIDTISPGAFSSSWTAPFLSPENVDMELLQCVDTKESDLYTLIEVRTFYFSY
jgi:hypothetical protein